MAKQRTFASLAWSSKDKVTRRERFLAEMDAVIPWAHLFALIEPHYPQAGRGRQPLGLEKMLRLYFVQQWFNLSDPQAEDTLYDSESVRRFVGAGLGDDVVPDETTILRFRHLLERHELTEQIFTAIRGLLEAKQLLLKSGTIVDATIVSAPSSTKNAPQTRDPEMHQTRKGKQWYFGMKLHIGTDPHGVVHRLTATDAAAADITQLPALLHGWVWLRPSRKSADGSRSYCFASPSIQVRRSGCRVLRISQSQHGSFLGRRSAGCFSFCT